MYNAIRRIHPLLRILLLFIPVVNWVLELVFRWSLFLKKGGLVNLVVAILAIPFGVILGWIDAVWCLVFRKLFLD